MTCQNCKCQKCRDASKAAMQAVLRSHVVPREISVDEINAAAIALTTEQSNWGGTFDAEQPSPDVVLEQERVG